MKNISLALALLCCTLTTIAQEPQLIDKISAIVGSEIILYSDVEIQALQVTEGASPTEAIRCETLEDLLFQKLLVNQARLDSVEVTEVEIQSTIQRRLDYFINIFGSEEAFVEWYGKSVVEWREEFRTPIEEQLLAQKAQQQIMFSVSITPGEVEEFFNALPSDSLPLMNEQVHYSQIAIDPEIDEEEKQHTISFMDSIKTRLSTGQSSMTLEAAKWSEDPGSRYKGGCYPMQQKNTFVPPYEAAVFNTEIGGYSDVFESEYGYHFVYVKDRRGNMYEACHILMIPEIDVADLERSRNELENIVEQIRTDSIDFKTAVAKYSTDEATKNQEGRVINLASGGTGFDISELPDPNIFMALSSVEKGEVSDPIRITKQDGKESWVVFQLNDRVPAHKANLLDDYLIFKNQAEADKQQKSLLDWVSKQLEKTYVRVEEDYHSCPFQFNWPLGDIVESK